MAVQTNFEKMTVDDFTKIFGQVINDAYDAVEVLETNGLREASYCDMCPITKNCLGFIDCRINLKEWANKKGEILDEIEKKYLKSVLAPWLNKKYGVIIEKWNNYTNTEEWLVIDIYSKNGCYDDSISFPNFPAGTMYKGMELNKQYTEKELGLR